MNPIFKEKMILKKIRIKSEKQDLTAFYESETERTMDNSLAKADLQRCEQNFNCFLFQMTLLHLSLCQKGWRNNVHLNM